MSELGKDAYLDMLANHHTCLADDCWKTKSGERVHIKDLSIQHLNNIIQMLGRNGDVPSDIDKLHQELARRKEFAWRPIDQAKDFAWRPATELLIFSDGKEVAIHTNPFQSLEEYSKDCNVEAKYFAILPLPTNLDDA